MDAVWGSMIIHTVGIAGYFIGRLLSQEKAPFYVDRLNVIGVAFMPVSMITGYLLVLIFKQGRIVPYPIGIFHTIVFCPVFFTVLVLSFIFIKKRTK